MSHFNREDKENLPNCLPDMAKPQIHYLTAEEQQKFESSLDKEQPKSKKPRSADDYARYRYVIPFAKVLTDHKHKKDLHKEITAVNTLGNLQEGTKVALHYGTSSQSLIEDEWPSLISIFLKDDPLKYHTIHLRAMFFAFENREKTVNLVVETLKCLSVASGGTFMPNQL